jgi:glutamate dehydrogenase/leucine dehydrogenase
MTENTILKTATYNLERSALRLQIDDAMHARLCAPKEKIEITLNPEFSNGKGVHIKTFIVRHCDALGPAKGGIRMSPDVTVDDVTGLSMEMTWKTSLIGVPFGGGKSGICFDASSISAQDKEIIIRAFTRSAKRHIGPEIYVPAPDMGTNEKDMGHIRDCISYSDGTSITRGCFVTGKPIVLGGIVGRREATGKGVVYTTLAACEKLGIDIKKARVAVQGFGNVGSVAAIAIAQAGAKVVAVADVHGGVYNEAGIDIQKLEAHVKSTGSLNNFAGCKAISSDGVLEVACDILIPAATQSQITIDNANKIQAKIIAEGANAPTTPEADEILKKRGIFVIPDILCNAGGVFVSYLEYTQETQREQMTLEQVERRLCERMKSRFSEVEAYAANKKLTMREAAMDIAVSRVVDAIVARGFLP